MDDEWSEYSGKINLSIFFGGFFWRENLFVMFAMNSGKFLFFSLESRKKKTEDFGESKCLYIIPYLNQILMSNFPFLYHFASADNSINQF